MFSLLKLKFQRNLVYEKSHFGVDFSEISAVAPAGLYFFLGGGGGGGEILSKCCLHLIRTVDITDIFNLHM